MAPRTVVGMGYMPDYKDNNNRMPVYPPEIDYSDKYADEYYEYRHVILPKDLMKKLPKGKLLTEAVLLCHHSGMARTWCTTVQGLDPL